MTSERTNKEAAITWRLRPIPLGMITYYPETLWSDDLTLFVLADTEEEARKMADERDRDGERSVIFSLLDEKHPWLSKQYSACERMSV